MAKRVHSAALTPETLARLGQQLAATRAELRRQIAQERDVEDGDAAPLPSAHDAVGDEASGEAMREIELEMASHHTRELVEVDHALARLDVGGYGLCVDCGEDIALARLEAAPQAARCIDCQARAEQSMPGVR